MYGGCRRCKIVYLIHLQKDRFNNIVPYQLKPLIVHEVDDVVLRAGEEVVETDHLIPFVQKPLAKVRTYEPGSSGDQYTFHDILPIP